MKRHGFLPHTLVWVVVAAPALLASGLEAGYELSRSAIVNGGTTSSAGNGFELSSTIGQPGAGMLSGGAFYLTGGFEFELGATDCNEDGTVDLVDYSAFEACFAGPDAEVPEGCECLDVNPSGTIDLADFARAQAAFNGS